MLTIEEEREQVRIIERGSADEATTFAMACELVGGDVRAMAKVVIERGDAYEAFDFVSNFPDLGPRYRISLLEKVFSSPEGHESLMKRDYDWARVELEALNVDVDEGRLAAIGPRRALSSGSSPGL